MRQVIRHALAATVCLGALSCGDGGGEAANAVECDATMDLLDKLRDAIPDEIDATTTLATGENADLWNALEKPSGGNGRVRGQAIFTWLEATNIAVEEAPDCFPADERIAVKAAYRQWKSAGW